GTRQVFWRSSLRTSPVLYCNGRNAAKISCSRFALEAGSWKLEAGSWKLEAGSCISVLAVTVDERFQCAAEFRREVVFLDGMQKRDSGLIGLQLGDAARAGGEMTLELGVDAGRKMMLDEISKEPDKIVAAAFLRHGRLSVQVRV